MGWPLSDEDIIYDDVIRKYFSKVLNRRVLNEGVPVFLVRRLARIALVGAVLAGGVAGIGLQVRLSSSAQAASTNDTTIFWITGGTSSIRKVKSDGTGNNAVSGPTSDSRGLATDGQYLYYANGTKLYRAGLDGSSPTEIATTSATTYNVVVDSTHLYYSQWNDGVFRVAKSGGTPEHLVTSSEKDTARGSSPASDGFSGVFVTSTYLYFVTYGAGSGTYSSLFRSDLTGTTASVTLLYADGDADGTSKINANDLAVTSSKIYLADQTGYDGLISLNLDGTGRSALFRAGRNYRGIEVAGSWMYFTNGSANIGRFPLADDTAPVTDLVTDASTAWDIALVDNLTVTYADGGATSGSAPVDSGTYLGGSSVTVLGNVNQTPMVKTGYEFYGWRLDQGGNTTYPSAGQTFTITDNATLTARWMGGPLEFATTPTGPAETTIAFPDTVLGETATVTVHVRNVGAANRDISNSGLQTGLGVSRTGGTCPLTGPNVISPYAAGATPDNTCTHVFTWSPTSATQSMSASFSTTTGPLSAQLTLTGQAVSAPRVPVFDTPVPTADGFTVNLTNWDAAWSWSPSVDVGSVAVGTRSGSTLPLTVTGLTASSVAVLTVASVRSGYRMGSTTASAAALGAARVPVFDSPVPTADGFTVNVTNWDSSWVWTSSVDGGRVVAGAAVGSILPLIVTGLAATASAEVTVETMRSGYVNGSARVAGRAFAAPTATTTSSAAPTTTSASDAIVVTSTTVEQTTVPTSSRAGASARSAVTQAPTDDGLPGTGSSSGPLMSALLALLVGLFLLVVRRRIV